MRTMILYLFIFILMTGLASASFGITTSNLPKLEAPKIVVGVGGNITNNFYSINATYNITNNITTENNITYNITNNITQYKNTTEIDPVFSANYTIYQPNWINHTLMTYNLWNSIWSSTSNATYDTWAYNQTTPAINAINVNANGFYNASNAYTKAQTDTNLSKYGLRISNGTTALTARAITRNNCSIAISTTATGVTIDDALIWNFNATSLTTQAQKSAWGNLTLDAYTSADSINFIICNPQTVSVTNTHATIVWRVLR